MLVGSPYYGSFKNFQTEHQYKAILVFSDQDQKFVKSFNRLCDETNISDPRSYILNNLKLDIKDLPDWKDLIYACDQAKQEILNDKWEKNRGETPELGTTWLINVNFAMADEKNDLISFLSDCINSSKILEEYKKRADKVKIIKIAEPIRNFEAFILDEMQFYWLMTYTENLRSLILENTSSNSWTKISEFNGNLDQCPIPIRILPQLHQLARKDAFDHQIYSG